MMDSSSESSSEVTVVSEYYDEFQSLPEKYLNREQILGFKPQRELIYSKFLPYAGKIDDESMEKLAEIKANLGKAVLLQEMRPGWEIWTGRLMKYIRLYGFKFSKEDHIAFAKLVYELLTIKGLEPYLVAKFANVLLALLKKKELLLPNGLVLPWRPLYDLVERTFNTNEIGLGMYRYTICLEATFDKLCHVARYYFPVSATSEMLELWKPLICPYDFQIMGDVIENYDWFLPLYAKPEEAHLGYKLWFDDIMNLWNTCNNAVSYEEDLMWLISRLSHNTIGYLDWEPHMSLMFTRFLRSFSLPVTYNQITSSKAHKIPTGAMALWIVSNLGGNSSCQDHLDQLMKTIESYFHPANMGRWCQRLKQILSKLPSHFLRRLHSERYKKTSIFNDTPDHKKLTEEDITKFVLSMQPVVMQAMFSRFALSDTVKALQILATLRPNIIIPPLIERLYYTLDSITEPHKLTCVMQCMVLVARPLVQSYKVYPEGITHVIPLMIAVLPGIDPNDLHKCFVTFQYLSTYAILVPIVNSSDAAKYHDLTEEESIVCSASAQFEDFIIQFMDRLFILVESSVLESTRLDREQESRSALESLAEGAIDSTTSTLLTQTSTEIFKVALDKIFSFTTSRILETKVSGSLLAHICASFGKVNPELTLHKFVPHLCKTILNLISHPGVQKEESLDKELLYYLQILGGVVNVSSKALLEYIPMLTELLDIILYLSCKEGLALSCKILLTILGSLSQMRPREFKSMNKSYDLPTSQFFPIREWGKHENIHDLNLQWYIPGKDEISCIQTLLSRYLPKELDRIDEFIRDEKSMDKNELHRCLSVIMAILGCSCVLPPWEEPVVHLLDTVVPAKPWHLELGVENVVIMPDGSNVRKTLVDKMHILQEKMLKNLEDDHKSLGCLITIWDFLSFNQFCSRMDFEKQWKAFHYLKRHLENRLIGEKNHIRTVLISRINLHHQTRQNTECVLLTETHRKLLFNLFTLSTSHYTIVRIKAQMKLFQLLEWLPFSYLVLMPRIIENLKQDPNIHHELFKGTLNVLLGPKRYPLIIRHNWVVLNELWSTLVRAIPSEKLSIVKLLENVREVVHKQFPTITLQLDVSPSCIDAAKRLWNQSAPPPLLEMPSEEEIKAGSHSLAATGFTNLKLYNDLLESLHSAVVCEKLHWRFNLLTFCLLRDLVHPNQQYPPNLVKLFLNTLVNDSIELRKVALRCTVFVLKQQKRSHPKQKIDPYVISGTSKSDPIVPGLRPDNAWLQYTPENRAVDEVRWEEPKFLHKTYVGFNVWPNDLKVYSPSKDQPKLDRSFDELSPYEKEVDIFFSNEKHIELLIKYFSLEEKKDTDKFNGLRMAMFKGLFRNHGDKHLALFKPFIEKLCTDENESSQRCAAELISGLIKGCKHWSFAKTETLWEFLVPTLRTAFANMTTESLNDWGVCIASAAKNRDPNRLASLLDLLMEPPRREESSFMETGRLFVLHCALNQFSWRIYLLQNRIYETILIPRVAHDFQNVRDRVSSMLTNTFDLDLSWNENQRPPCPHMDEFVQRFLPELNHLYSLWELKYSKTNSMLENLSENLNKTSLDGDRESKDKENERLIRLFKTVCKTVLGCLKRNIQSGLPCFYELFPLMCLFENYESDDELKSTCKSTIAMLAQALLLPEHIPSVLASIKKVSEMNSWLARLACLEFTKCFLFYNLSTIMSNSEWIAQMYNLVFCLLEDERVEIREKSGIVLSSLIHVNFIKDQNKLYEKLLRMCRKHYNKKRAQVTQLDIRTIHAGIIGLCAFVNASPYDVMDPVPEIFQILGEHLNDPQPIPATIRKTLGDFKRTHHGNWEIHKLKFSEQQLEVLDELIIPPSYYA